MPVGTFACFCQNTVPIIAACVVLHNICDEMGDSLKEYVARETVNLPEPYPPDSATSARLKEEGDQVRDALADFMLQDRFQ